MKSYLKHPDQSKDTMKSFRCLTPDWFILSIYPLSSFGLWKAHTQKLKSILIAAGMGSGLLDKDKESQGECMCAWMRQSESIRPVCLSVWLTDSSMSSGEQSGKSVH